MTTVAQSKRQYKIEVIFALARDGGSIALSPSELDTIESCWEDSHPYLDAVRYIQVDRALHALLRTVENNA